MLLTDFTNKTQLYTMSAESIEVYLQHEQTRGASANSLRSYRRATASLYEWLADDKSLSKSRLFSWRQSLKAHGYSYSTEMQYVKGINRYLDFTGMSELRFNRSGPKDIAGMKFGLLTAVEPTGEKNRKDYIWRCICDCGKELECTATRLLSGNTLSCGCLRKGHFKAANMYIDGTSLRQSINEQIFSTRSESGYTGVTTKRGLWKAYITYKGRYYSLGCYTELEDAVKARAQGKELVRQDASELLSTYEQMHKGEPEPPSQPSAKEAHRNSGPMQPDKPRQPVIRTNNTSGCTGVHRKRGKWEAKITYNNVTYHLGNFTSFESAVAARKEAEELLAVNPRVFMESYAALRPTRGKK